MIDISAVRYFLIRDMDVEMTRSHTTYRKMRRLEPNIWERYLAGCPGFRPDKMIIYHWASLPPSPTEAVESFTALATFRAYYTGSLWLYGLVIVLLGAIGSAVQNLGAATVGATLDPHCSFCGSKVDNLILIGVLIIILVVLVGWQRRKK